ncbi:Uncharacterized protein Fot_33305 [Forsythia ovata]|uniref:Uncharacterized protein n=1 Tax=Forsythia ovata TaxID=205694 RepID=A0ABD1TAT0_9LAMI
MLVVRSQQGLVAEAETGVDAIDKSFIHGHLRLGGDFYRLTEFAFAVAYLHLKVKFCVHRFCPQGHTWRFGHILRTGTILQGIERVKYTSCSTTTFLNYLDE